MELVWDIHYAVLKDGSLIVDQYIRNDSLERPGKRLTIHCFSCCGHFVHCVYFLLFYGLACFVVFSYPVR